MTTRKDFLVAGTLAAAIPGTALAASPAALQHPKAPKLDFDLEAFNALLDGAQAHKHLFTAVQIDGGEVLSAHAQYAERLPRRRYRIGATSFRSPCSITVFRFFLAFDDFVWNRYVIPFSGKLKHGNGAAQIASVRRIQPER